MADNGIVVWDPSGEYLEGQVVGMELKGYVESHGGAVLPVNTDFFRLTGVAGYHRRAWGLGIPIETISQNKFCPLSLWIDARLRRYDWKAMLVPTDTAMVKAALGGNVISQGSLRLIAEAGVVGELRASLHPEGPVVDGAKLGVPNSDECWLVGGGGAIDVRSDGFYGFALYGAMLGMRVAWAAVTVSGPIG